MDHRVPFSITSAPTLPFRERLGDSVPQFAWCETILAEAIPKEATEQSLATAMPDRHVSARHPRLIGGIRRPDDVQTRAKADLPQYNSRFVSKSRSGGPTGSAPSILPRARSPDPGVPEGQAAATSIYSRMAGGSVWTTSSSPRWCKARITIPTRPSGHPSVWVTTHPYYQRHVRRERSEWPPAGCSPGSPWTADSLRCGNRLGRTCGCGSTPRLSA